MTMVRKARLAEQTEEDEVRPITCRACGRFLGAKTLRAARQVRVYCASEPWCMSTREWVTPDERLTDIAQWLVEYEGVPAAELARTWRISRLKINSAMDSRDTRALRARM